MTRIIQAAALTAAFAIGCAAPAYAATASNSQNGTTSTNPYATSEAPRSPAEVPATGTGMAGTDGSPMMKNGQGMSTKGSMGTGANGATGTDTGQ